MMKEAREKVEYEEEVRKQILNKKKRKCMQRTTTVFVVNCTPQFTKIIPPFNINKCYAVARIEMRLGMHAQWWNG